MACIHRLYFGTAINYAQIYRFSPHKWFVYNLCIVWIFYLPGNQFFFLNVSLSHTHDKCMPLCIIIIYHNNKIILYSFVIIVSRDKSPRWHYTSLYHYYYCYIISCRKPKLEQNCNCIRKRVRRRRRLITRLIKCNERKNEKIKKKKCRTWFLRSPASKCVVCRVIVSSLKNCCRAIYA